MRSICIGFGRLEKKILEMGLTEHRILDECDYSLVLVLNFSLSLRLGCYMSGKISLWQLFRGCKQDGGVGKSL